MCTKLSNLRQEILKNDAKICTAEKNGISLHRFWDDESHWLGLSYGVMVALQFLVLPVLVRIRVRQLDRGIASAILFLFPYVSLCRRQKHAFMS